MLTHHKREPPEMKGGTTFYFITDGIESAMKKCKDIRTCDEVNGWTVLAAQEVISAFTRAKQSFYKSYGLQLLTFP